MDYPAFLKPRQETISEEGIVIERFQHLTKKWNCFNGLKRKLTTPPQADGVNDNLI